MTVWKNQYVRLVVDSYGIGMQTEKCYKKATLSLCRPMPLLTQVCCDLPHEAYDKLFTNFIQAFAWQDFESKENFPQNTAC